MLSYKLKRHQSQSYSNVNRKLIRLDSDQYWIDQLHQALSQNRFQVYLQEVIRLTDLSSRRYYEVSVRLIDSNGRIIDPAVFMPVAERYYLLPEIEHWMVHNLLDFLAQIPAAILDNSCFAINLSNHSLNNCKFLRFLHEKLGQLEITPDVICFEIKEQVALSHLSTASDLITSFQTLGYYFALEDFGMGMSSLSYLKHLPVDYLKIPSNFIKNMLADPADQTIVEMIHYLGKKLGLQTIAENVDNAALLNAVKEIGVDYAKGSYLKLPCPLKVALGLEAEANVVI